MNAGAQAAGLETGRGPKPGPRVAETPATDKARFKRQSA